MAATGMLLGSSSSGLWLTPIVALLMAGLMLLYRRRVSIAQNLGLIVALVAAIAITGADNPQRNPIYQNGVPAAVHLPGWVLGVPAVWRMSAPSVTILIFVLIAFLFSLSWLVTARPGSKGLFWLVLQFACIWGIVTAANLTTIFTCAQMLLIPQYFLNLGAGTSHGRRIARRMLLASLASQACILVAMVFFRSPGLLAPAAMGGMAAPVALMFIILAIWISLSLFPFHSVVNARMTIDGQNLLPLNSNLWTGLALMLWLQNSALALQLTHISLWLAMAGCVALAACSVACFAQRELARSMAYAAGAVSALAFLSWLALNPLGTVGAVLILGVLPVTIFGFQRGIDLLFLQSRDLTIAAEGGAAPGGATRLLFLLLTAACIGMPATAVFRGVWFALVGIILSTARAGEINWQTVLLVLFSLIALMPMILGIISRSLLAFRDPAQNIRRPDINVYAEHAGVWPDANFTAPLNVDAYVRTARRWAIWAMLVSLTLGIFPTLATGPLLDSFQMVPPATPRIVPRRLAPPVVRMHTVIVARLRPMSPYQHAANAIGGSYQ